MGWHFQSAEKDLTKNSMSYKTFPKIKDKLIHSQILKLRLYHYQTSPRRNIKGSPSGWNEKALSHNLLQHEEINALV